MKLSIIMPAHNEEHRLPPVLAGFASFYTEHMGREADLLVVVNGSDDGTLAVAHKLARQYDNIRVIDEPRKVGKGGAVIRGIKQSSGEYIGFVDADGATSVEAFHTLYTQALGSDGAIASRWMKGSVVDLPQKLSRRISSRIFNMITRVLFSLNYSDTQCGAKVFRGTALAAILPSLGITRWAFDVDLLFHLRRNGYVVKEFPTVWDDAEGSKVKMRKVAFEMMMALIRLRLIYSPFKWIVTLYDRIFVQRRQGTAR